MSIYKYVFVLVRGMRKVWKDKPYNVNISWGKGERMEERKLGKK